MSLFEPLNTHTTFFPFIYYFRSSNPAIDSAPAGYNIIDWFS